MKRVKTMFVSTDTKWYIVLSCLKICENGLYYRNEHLPQVLLISKEIRGPLREGFAEPKHIGRFFLHSTPPNSFVKYLLLKNPEEPANLLLANWDFGKLDCWCGFRLSPLYPFFPWNFVHGKTHGSSGIKRKIN